MVVEWFDLELCQGLCGKNLKVVGFRVKLTATTRDDATGNQYKMLTPH